MTFVTLFGILRLRATVLIPRILYFPHPQMTEKICRLTEASRNLWLLTKRTSHVQNKGEEDSRIALKVSHSETYFFIWLTQTILIGLTE